MKLLGYIIVIWILCIPTDNLIAQTWSGDVAEIIYENCTVCHNPNGIGGFTLINYDNVFTNRRAIKSAILSGYMPPWIADPQIGHYSGERLLSLEDKATIISWIEKNCPSGDLSQAPPPPIYSNRRFLQKEPDYQVQIPAYRSKATDESDDYVCFSIPTNLTEEKIIKAIEVIPGNIETVHHALVFVDPTGNSTTDTVGGDCGGPSEGYLVTGYVPGSTPTIFPSTEDFNSGIRLPVGSNIVLAVHYPEGSFGSLDRTKVNFYFYDDPINFREISSSSLIQNWRLNFPPNKTTRVKEVYPQSGGLAGDFTLLSTFPHMHLLGSSIKSYFVNKNDTTHLISIPKWNFNWQDFYFFKYLQKIPKGSKLYGEAVYDNTSNNPFNPNDPPIRVRAGLNTTDEMFLIYYHYMTYQEGDEFINVDSLNELYLTSSEVFHTNTYDINVYPNPAKDYLTLNYSLTRSAMVSLFIYDSKGKLIKKLLQNTQQNSGEQTVKWNILDANKSVPKGVYYYSMRVNGEFNSGPIIISD